MVRVLFGGELLGAVVHEVNCVEKSIWVAMFEWAWYPGQHTGTIQDVSRALCQAGERGLEVRVVLHNEAMGRTLHRLNRTSAGHLRQHKVEVKFGNTGAPVHAKVWVFDRARVIIGSHNISVRAVRSNVEVSVLLDDCEAVGEVVKWFEVLWAKAM